MKNFKKYVRNENIDEIKNLIKKGEDMNKENKNGTTALMMAASYDRPEIVETLITSGVDIKTEDKHNSTALCEAASNDCYESMRLLVESGANVNQRGLNGNTPLIESVQKCNLEAVKLLVKSGADVNIENDYGCTALFYIVPFATYDPYLKEETNTLKIASLLIESGAQINKISDMGRTPLMWSARGGDTEMVKFLLEKGSDSAIVDKGGLSALAWAIISKNYKAADLLIKHNNSQGSESSNSGKMNCFWNFYLG